MEIIANRLGGNTTQIGGGRFGNVDRLKVLCAFLVVCIHAPFPGIIGEYITTFARIAVPIFFMITGYFYDFKRSKKQIIKTGKLIVIAFSIYFLWHVALSVLRNNLASFFSSNFTLTNLVKLLVFNDIQLGAHLWYLNAILYVLVVAFLRKVTPHHWKIILYAITPILLAGDLIFEKYSLAFFGREFPYIIVRNWLFVGIPYFTLGMWIRDNETAINDKLGKNGKLVCYCGVFLCCITTIFERQILVSNDLNATRDHYLSSTFLAISVFILFLRFVGRNENRISKIGKLDTTWIYILHPLVITVMEAFISRINVIQNTYEYCRPIIIFLVTTMGVKVMMRMKARFYNQLRENKQPQKHRQ